ncbi:MAG: transporter substrate-binding domain-containing protein [Magnetococcales bacterium]|nr:transporter substrate-binding domain-containing protein [Magnetococcales bacterium]
MRGNGTPTSPSKWLTYWRNSLLWVLLLLPLLAIPAHAQEAEKLPLATVEFPPFHFEREGRVIGFITEIVEAGLRRIGYQPEIQIYPSKRGKYLAERGDLAGIFAFTINPERKKSYLFSRPLGCIRDVFFKRKKDDIAWETLSDLSPYLVGATETYNYAPVFLNAMRSGHFQSDLLINSHPELLHLRKITAGHIDLAICELSVCSHLRNENAPEFDTLDYIPKVIGPVRGFHLGFSRAWPEADTLRKRFDQAVIALKEEGVVAGIYQKYGIAPCLRKWPY